MGKKIDVLIVGAGFAGIYALHKMRKMGLKAVVLEAADDIGGTWHWNTYPGARCDVESFQYSYSFDDELQQTWEWSERYAAQPEILAYLKHVVERFDLAAGIQLNTRVTAAQYQETSGCWKISTDDESVECQFLVMATGCLSTPGFPDIEGRDDFQGEMTHTGLWPKAGIALRDKRVGVIGTGSSGVQVISEIAGEAEQLFVFQRTPHWVAMAGNRPLSAPEKIKVKAAYKEMRAFMENSLLGMHIAPGQHSALAVSDLERKARYDEAWDIGGAALLMTFNDLLVNDEANQTASDYLAGKICEIVDDPETAAALIPDAKKYPLGGRRMVQDDAYYETFNRENVTLIDTLNDPIEKISANGVKTEHQEINLDVIIFATGFDAVTGTLLNIDITGKAGIKLRDKWQEGPRAYLGVAVESFPNLFMVTGPGSPSVLSNMVLSIEQHVDWIADAIGWMGEQGLQTIEARAEAEADWGRSVIEAAKPTVLFNTSSWYRGSNVKGKPAVFLAYLGGVGSYREICDAVARDEYPGFVTH